MRTDTVVATQAGVSRDTIRKIEKIQETAAPEVLAAVRSGEISINAAAQVAALPLDRQAAAAAGGAPGIKHAAAETRTIKPKVDEHASEAESLREQLAEARETAADLAHELEAYRVVEAGTHLEEIQKLQNANRILKSQLNDYTNQCQQLKKQLKMLQRQAGGSHG